MLVQLTQNQCRVIGVLLEKEKTTPDQYPLTLNAVTLACNQKSNREPVMQLSESDVQSTLDELREKNLTFEISGSGSRVLKYKHRFCNTEFNSLKFTEQQTAIVCVMLLRGPQTAGELRTRTNRLAEFANVNEVEAVLASLTQHNGEKIVLKLAREPGKRDSRYSHLFSGTPSFSVANEPLSSVSSAGDSASHDSASQKPSLSISNEADKARIDNLETQVKLLNQEINAIKEALGLS
jgi:uncharacterized protein YceH (UPF0502 family)